MSFQITEPQGTLGVFKNGWSLFVAAFSSLWMLALAAGLLNTWFSVYSELHPEVLEGESFGMLGLSVVSTLLGMLLTMIMLRRLDNIARGLLADIDDEFSTAVRAFLPFCLASLLYGLGMVIGIFVLIIPGVFVMVAFGFYAMYLVLEGRGPIKSLEASFRLVEGQWWYAFGFMLLIIVAAVVVISALVVPAAVVAEILGWDFSGSGGLGEIVFGGMLNMLLEPLGLALMLSMYYELQARKSRIPTPDDE
jgi:hypothetical protein